MPEILDPEDIAIDDKQDEIAQISPSALATLNQSDHAACVQTANMPGMRRKPSEFINRLKEWAAPSQAIALLMFYSLPRANKRIIGPSVRFAEVVAPCWRNCQTGSRAISDDANTVTAQGRFIDYESNLFNVIEVPRRITDKDGKRYNDDMIVVTLNAAMSVARRNAVLKGGVPQALWTPGYEHAMSAAVGKAPSHEARVNEAMDYLYKLGVTEWAILNSVGVPSPKELETEHLVTLRVLCQEIKRGDKTIEEVFGSPFDKEIDALFVQLKKNDTQQRLLRQSYMGRAKDLLEYLRSQVAPAPRSTPPTPTPAPVKTAAPAPPVQEPPAPVAAAPQPVPVAEAPPPEQPHDDAEDAAMAASVVTDEPQGTGFEFGANVGDKEPTARPRRGRPSKEESARRTAQSAPQPETQEMEDQDDSFAF
jgi:hypothetical protein